MDFVVIRDFLSPVIEVWALFNVTAICFPDERLSSYCQSWMKRRKSGFGCIHTHKDFKNVGPGGITCPKSLEWRSHTILGSCHLDKLTRNE